MKQANHVTESKEDIQVFLSAYPPSIISIVVLLRKIVRDVVPEAIEQIDYPAKMIAYGYQKTYKDMICVIMPYKNWVNLGFPRGTTLTDPDCLLSGTGKRARHVKITSMEEVSISVLSSLIQASIMQLQD